MRKIIVLLVLVAFAAGLVLIASDSGFAAWGKKKDEEAVAEAAPEAPEAEVIYSFKGEEEMGEFEQFYVSKQATFGRMGVLQAYFAMEQNNLLEIDKQMQERFGFKMDPTKMYDLNRDTLEIRELGAIPMPPAPAE